MDAFSNLARRFWNWIRPGIEVDDGTEPSRGKPSEEFSLRSPEQRRKLDACNQALAAAVDGRDHFRQAATQLTRRRERCQADLHKSVEASDAESGAEHALRLQELIAEEKELQQRLEAAQTRVDELSVLREQLLGHRS